MSAASMRHFSLICARCCPVMQFISATGYSNVNPWCNNRATIFYVVKTREYNLSVHTSVLLWRTVLYCQMGLTAFQRNIAFYSASKLMPDEGALNERNEKRRTECFWACYLLLNHKAIICVCIGRFPHLKIVITKLFYLISCIM